MSQSGPSREELENYYKNSRSYFDELAKHYYETDREYYDKYIAPFYGPFSGIVPGNKAAASKITLLSAMILVAVIGAAVAFFLAVENDNPKGKKNIEEVEETIKKNTDDRKVTKDPDSNKKKTLSDYERGIEYFNLEDYAGAERYLRRVQKSDKNYEDAQEKLGEIKELKKTSKNKK